MYNQDYDAQNPNDYTSGDPTTQAGPTATQQGLTPVPGHPGLYYNTGGVVFDESGKQVDGYVNPATGAFQTGTPTTNPNTGIIEPPGTTHGDPVAPPLPPPPTGGGGGGAPAPTPTTTAAPAPTFTPPTYTPPPAFNYADFVAPNPSDLNNDPAYQYTLKTEQDRIQKSAAARGILNTGGTINDLLGNAADIASNGYHDLFTRGMQTYLTNRGNAVDQYNTNYGTQYTDPFKFNYQGLQDQYNSQAHNYDTNRQYDWYGKLFDEQKLNDAFDKKYRIYSTL